VSGEEPASVHPRDNCEAIQGQPLVAGGDIQDGELKIASKWSCVQHLCRMGNTDADLGFW
jgi:hypothetical protein